MDDLKALTEIRKYSSGKLELLTDVVIRENSFTIFINSERFISLASIPQDLKELAFGFLFSEGLILDKKEIIDFQFSYEDRAINFKLEIPKQRISDFYNSGEKTSGCGSTLSSAISGDIDEFPKKKLNPENILSLMSQMQRLSDLFKETGGTHIACLVFDEKIIFSASDIGRHNAVDKVIGMGLIDEIDLSKCSILSSGRISSEIVKKCVRVGIPIIISKSAPTSEAVRLGWDYKTYIIGFARGKRFNVYTGFDELLLI